MGLEDKGGKKGLCSFCSGNHLVVNYWKKNGYPPRFKSKFIKVNAAISCEDMEEQDLIEHNFH